MNNNFFKYLNNIFVIVLLIIFIIIIIDNFFLEINICDTGSISDNINLDSDINQDNNTIAGHLTELHLIDRVRRRIA
jgi:hypothetical protein